MAEGKEEKEVFWADQTAGEILSRKKFHYTDSEMPKFRVFVIKT